MNDLESRVRALEAIAEGTGSFVTPRLRDGRIPYQEVETSDDIEITTADLNMVWIVENGAAIDFTLPDMAPGDWIAVVNDSTSSNDITVKDSGGGTVTTVSPGESSGQLIADRNNTPAPPL